MGQDVVGMVKIKAICRKCFAEKGHSVEILPDPITDEFVCKRDPKHRYKREEDGSFTSL